MAPRALIVGLSGPRLTGRERDFLREADPWGVILFTRNIETESQVSDLAREIRLILDRADAPVLVDQEGGRVQRLAPPGWPAYPAARLVGDLYRREREAGLEAAWLAGRLIADDLARAGITVACLPVLDLALAGGDPIIGDRAYGGDPAEVAALGRTVARGVLDGGCLPVIKHMPGHGRAPADSHVELPRVGASLAELRKTDLAPFAALRDLPIGMTAHVVYDAADPERPATLSPRIIGELIRGEIGFDGLLMSDDLSMGALCGPVAGRGAAAIAAGCDIALHCNGDMAEMEGLAVSVPRLEGRALERAEAALARLNPAGSLNVAAARGRLAAALGAAA